MRNELFIAIDSAADAYIEYHSSIDDLEKAINEDFAPSLIHKEFDTEERKLGFCDALEFCSESLGCEKNICVVVPDSDEERERLMNLSLHL